MSQPTIDAKPTPFYERDLRRALCHLRAAFEIVRGLGELTEDDFANTDVQESIKDAYSDVKEFGVHQFGIEFKGKGVRS
jgi:hypothetical protein